MKRLFKFKLPKERWLAASEGGQGLAEYALILAMVAVACVGALTALGGGIAGSAGFIALPGNI